MFLFMHYFCLMDNAVLVQLVAGVPGVVNSAAAALYSDCVNGG